MSYYLIDGIDEEFVYKPAGYLSYHLFPYYSYIKEVIFSLSFKCYPLIDSAQQSISSLINLVSGFFMYTEKKLSPSLF